MTFIIVTYIIGVYEYIFLHILFYIMVYLLHIRHSSYKPHIDHSLGLVTKIEKGDIAKSLSASMSCVVEPS